jgi:hypothetical protein
LRLQAKIQFSFSKQLEIFIWKTKTGRT